jgi:hypothetical protein
MVHRLLFDRRPDLFLSHSTDDKDIVAKFAEDLQVCEVDVWLDKWEIGVGDSLYFKINDGITRSRYVMIFLSQSFLKKKWTSVELQAAHSRQVEEGKVIIPVLLEPVEIPILLRDRLYISVADDYFGILTKLAGLVHDIPVEDINRAIEKFQPKSLEAVVETIKYAGRDVYMIVPKEVFEEIAATGLVEISGERLSFSSIHILPVCERVSPRARDYIRRLNGSIKQVN